MGYYINEKIKNQQDNDNLINSILKNFKIQTELIKSSRQYYYTIKDNVVSKYCVNGEIKQNGKWIWDVVEIESRKNDKEVTIKMDINQRHEFALAVKNSEAYVR